MTEPDFMPYGMVSGGRTGDWIDKVPVTKLYKKFNTTMGTRDTPILGLSGFTSAMENRATRMRIPIEPEDLGHSISSKRVGKITIAKSFLVSQKAISTFQGHPVVRVNIKLRNDEK
jgi:hypothetical protein